MKGLWNVEWSQQPRLSPWAGPPQRPTHSFHSSGWGWNIKPLLGTEGPPDGSSREELREGILYWEPVHFMATAGQWEVVEPGPGELSPGLPGAELSGKAYRRSLGHVCTIGSSLGGAGCVRGEPEWTVRCLSRRLMSGSLQISSTTSEWSLHSPGLSPCLDRMSAPILWTPGM